MKSGDEWFKNSELIGSIASDILAFTGASLSNIAMGAFTDGVSGAFKKINVVKARRKIFNTVKEKAKDKHPELKDKFDTIKNKDLPNSLLFFKNEDEFCKENPKLCNKLTKDGCNIFCRLIQEEFSRYVLINDDFFKELTTQLLQDQSEEIRDFARLLSNNSEDLKKLIQDQLSETQEIIINKIDELQENLKPKTKIEYFPPNTEDVTDFINRNEEQYNLKKLIIQKKNLIFIQGIAGIGKTQLATKVKENINNYCATYWYEIRIIDTFNSITRNLAGFFRNNNNSELADYLEEEGMDHDVIINILFKILKEKHYVLFFDNYQVIEDHEVHDLFMKFKDNLTNSTVIITTREPPLFISSVDKIKNKVIEENIEGFDLEATKKYLEQLGVEVSYQQLVKINKKIGGHPLSISMFASLSKIKEIDEIIENIPETGINEYLYDEIYMRLSSDEQEVLETISVFRSNVTVDACIQVSQSTNIKKILIDLGKKLLLKRKNNLYYTHDLIREFSYNMIDNPKDYHNRAAEYYQSQEKNHENLIEASHHLLKNYGIINGVVIEYFLSMPYDTYSFFIINEILKHNKIDTSGKIFELFDKFMASNNIQIITAFILSYGYYFESIYSIDKRACFSVYHKILQSYSDLGVLEATSQSIKEIAENHPSESLKVWKSVIERSNFNKRIVEAVVFHIKDTKLKSDEYIDFLKDVLPKTNGSLRIYFIKIFEDWGITDYQLFSISDNLNEIRNLDMIESIYYLENNYKLMNPWFTVQISSEFIKYDKIKVLNLIKNIIDYHKESWNMMLFQVSEILCSSLERDELDYINIFLKKENDTYTLLVGIRTLDLMSNKYESELLFTYLDPLLSHENITISKMAKLTKKNILDKGCAKPETRKDFNMFFKFIKICKNPQNITSMIKTEFRHTAPFAISVMAWGIIKTIENTDTDEIIDVCESVLDSSNPVMLDASKWIMNKLQNEPKEFTNFIYKYGYKNKKITWKYVTIPWIIMMGNLVPETVDKYLRIIMEDEDEAVYSLMGNFMLYKNQNHQNREDILKYLIGNKNKDISGFADYLLNNI